MIKCKTNDLNKWLTFVSIVVSIIVHNREIEGIPKHEVAKRPKSVHNTSMISRPIRQPMRRQPIGVLWWSVILSGGQLCFPITDTFRLRP